MDLSESIHLRLRNELVSKLDEHRRRHANPPSRQDAIKKLLEEGLARQAEATPHQQAP